MSDSSDNRTVEKLLRQQAALAAFGSFAFRETDLLKILTEAARTCAVSLDVPFSKVCRYRAGSDDLLIEAGWGWNLGVVGRVVSQADESSPCMCSSRLAPARSCRSSTFWVTISSSPGHRASSRARASWAGFGATDASRAGRAS